MLAPALFAAVLAAGLAAPGGAHAAAEDVRPGDQLDRDPLRRFLPSADLYLPVPGGVLAVEDVYLPGATIEELAAQRDGGLIIGYCLKSSCSRVTHLAALQVCANRLDGPDGSHELVLGVVRLPYGKTPGFVKSLQGRDYAYNFAAYGPFERTLLATSTGEVSSIYALSADGMGPVADPALAGVNVQPQQRSDTLALNLQLTRDHARAIEIPHFEVRHFCERHVS